MIESGAPRAPALERLLEHLRLIDDRAERIELLIEIADRYRGVPDSIARRPYPQERLVPACESEAYFWAQDLEGPTGPFRIHFAVENPQGISARALAVILDETLSGRPLAELVGVSGDLPLEIFGRELSLGKNLGLTGMVEMVRSAARARVTADSHCRVPAATGYSGAETGGCEGSADGKLVEGWSEPWRGS